MKRKNKSKSKNETYFINKKTKRSKNNSKEIFQMKNHQIQ